jgi:hypothetical protein
LPIRIIYHQRKHAQLAVRVDWRFKAQLPIQTQNARPKSVPKPQQNSRQRS